CRPPIAIGSSTVRAPSVLTEGKARERTASVRGADGWRTRRFLSPTGDDMKTRILSALSLLTLLLLAGMSGAQSNFYLKPGDRVVFYGDSITDQRLYTTFTEAYVVTRFPRLNVTFIHSGWGGDRVTGGGGGPIDLRLQRDVFAYKPTVMTI